MATKGEQVHIPTGKIERASRFIATGAKVGANYVKYYAKKAIDKDTTRDELNKDNAEDIYSSLSELKGSALKVLQVMSMDKNALPTAFQDKFSMAQYSAPPLSFPLVVKTFREAFDKAPTQLYETFSTTAIHAASIGQVHEATLDGVRYAVKIQYPGVADSIKSDLALVKPFAIRMFNLKPSDVSKYMQEVEERLLEECDYELECSRGTYITEASAHIPNLVFPKYFKEFTRKRILAMQWLDGLHMDEFLKTNPSQELRNQIGQALWDFIHFQIHQLRMVHADPHPGNFLITNEGKLGVIDFGCVKQIPDEFYDPYFKLLKANPTENKAELSGLYHQLEFLFEDDSEGELSYFTKLFDELIALLAKPFRSDVFDFSDEAYFSSLTEMGLRLSKDEAIRKDKKPRGSRHSLYINRTYFGLYQILHQLKASISTKSV